MVFWDRLVLNSEEKVRLLKWRGGGCSGPKSQNRVFLPILSKNSGSLACLCITDSLSHTTYVETNQFFHAKIEFTF